MLREHLGGVIPGERDFRWRGTEISRLEGFSDAVFAFAITLLVVSLEVPRTFHELMEAMRGFFPFAICFALITQLWFQHYRYFRRYGLQTPLAVMLNCVLLFFVLFYVYPLKFLFVNLFGGNAITASEVRTLFVIYGLGYAAMFLTMGALYFHAWRLRRELELNAVEEMRTRHAMANQVVMAAFGIASALLAVTLPARVVGLAGYFYTLVGVYFTIAGTVFGKRERQLAESGKAA